MTDMQALEPLVGEWTAEAVMPGGGDGVRGSMTVEWLEGGGYLIQNDQMTRLLIMSVNLVIFFVLGSVVDLNRTSIHAFYRDRLEGGVLRLWRDDDWAQRYVGRFSDDGSAIEGAWERCDDGETWAHDFALTFRRKT